MERLTKVLDNGRIVTTEAEDLSYGETVDGCFLNYFTGEAIDHLAAYEDTGLEPEEIKTAVEIVKMLAKTDYPHNFQRENPWVVKFCNKIARIQEIAKLWMIETIRNREEADNGTTD